MTTPEFDPGPPATLADHFAAVPGYPPEQQALFWYAWGPIFYRGRLDRTARLVGIASDPGPTERIAGRTLVGDAGQRVQGFLSKLGLTRSYVLVNAFAYAVHPSASSKARKLLADPEQLGWRNALYDAIVGPDLQAVVAFGGNAQAALALWENKPDLPTFEIPHPSDHNTADLLAKWAAAIPQLRDAVDPDPDGDATGANYGASFTEADYAPIPHRDLPFGLPAWVGDDSWGRSASPRHNDSVERLSTDPDLSLCWHAPPS